MKENIENITKKLDNLQNSQNHPPAAINTSTEAKPATFADLAKRLKQPSVPANASNNAAKPEFNPSTVLVLAGNINKDEVAKPYDIQQVMSSTFRRVKLTRIFKNRITGQIQLHFHSQEDAQTVFTSWNSTLFGKNTTVNFLKKNNNSVILKMWQRQSVRGTCYRPSRNNSNQPLMSSVL